MKMMQEAEHVSLTRRNHVTHEKSICKTVNSYELGKMLCQNQHTE